MFAYVKDGSIVSMPRGNVGINIDDLQYSADIFTAKWTESERNAIGIYTIEVDDTNRKDEEYYLNTDITYAYDSSADKVKGTYGSATAKPLDDVKWTQSEIDAGKAPSGADTNTVNVIGLKNRKKTSIDEQCAGILAPSDWRVVREQETGDDMDSGWKTWRGNVRTKCNSMQTQIDNAANVDALAALYAYNTDNPPTRPLGEFPVKE